jgi:hypothetical protein
VFGRLQQRGGTMAGSSGVFGSTFNVAGGGTTLTGAAGGALKHSSDEEP